MYIILVYSNVIMITFLKECDNNLSGNYDVF